MRIASTCTTFAALAASLPLLPLVAASVQTFQVQHQPITGLFDQDGNAIAYDFLKPRFVEKDAEAFEFRRRKRSLSGAGSHRSARREYEKECRDTQSKNSKGDQSGNSDDLDDVFDDARDKIRNQFKGLNHFIHKGWKHDREFGVILAKAENDEADNEFLVNVTVGTPPQTVKMVLDTGSSEAWVYSPACCYAEDHAFVDPSRSLTYSNRTVVNGTAVRAPPGTPGQPFQVEYGSGSATRGYVGVDTLGFEHNKIKVVNQSIAFATNITGSRRGREMDGLIGLATGSGTEIAGSWTTPFEAMSQRGLLDHTYLSATLIKSDRVTGLGGGGQYTFGEVDTSLLRGEVTWTKVLSAYFWAAYFQSMKVGDLTLASGSGNVTNPIRYLVDTGTAYITMPPAMSTSANNAIYGSYKTNSTKVQLPWLVPCDTGERKYERSLAPKDRNRPLTMAIENVTFSLPMEDYVFFPQYPVPASEAGGRDNMCYSAIQDGLPSLTVLGLSWIKNHVLVFDQGGPTLQNRRLAMGKRKDVKYDI